VRGRVLSFDEKAVVDEALIHLGRLGWKEGDDPSLRVFHRRGQLVHVIRSPAETVCGVEVEAGTPLVRALPRSTFRERIALAAKFGVYEKVNGNWVFMRKRPTDWLVNSGMDRGEYPPAIHALSGIVTSPTLRPDGTVLQTPGYDEATGFIYEPDVAFPHVEDMPSLQTAREAAERLLDVVSDFPFLGPPHKSVWLSMPLTFMARIAIRGPTPMFVIGANTPAAGKGLLLDVAAEIVYGRSLPRKTYPVKDAEVAKTITAALLQGFDALNLDNVDGQFGCPSLDAYGTSVSWTDRVLGESTMTASLPARMVICATGNNLSFAADTARRVLLCRLHSDREHPEDRSDFRLSLIHIRPCRRHLPRHHRLCPCP